MKRFPLSWQAIIALILCLCALVGMPLMADTAAVPPSTAAIGATLVLLGGGALLSMARFAPGLRIGALLAGSQGAAWFLVSFLDGNQGQARAAFFCLVAAGWLLAWRAVSELSALDPQEKHLRTGLGLLIPAIFGAWVLILWETVTRGAGIPFVLLPPPSAIGARLAASLPILFDDIRQTVFKAVLAGYLIGCLAGFATAILADRVDFLRRGLLPVGNFVSALPMIGIAPIMVMWFGFDWQSKAAVVIIMTFFPMLVNTVEGLTAAGHMERDLMRTYAASYRQTLLKLRLPAAMPFVFNALKINSTLALIGAIVAEFFGTPIVGMGFRISTEIGRMNLDMVWAEIAVAAIAGSLFYGIVALIERTVTFWHPSMRSR